MAFALTNSSQRVQTVVRDAASLRRTAFTGSRSAFLPLNSNRQYIRQIGAQALFTRNKEDKVGKRNPLLVDPGHPPSGE